MLPHANFENTMINIYNEEIFFNLVHNQLEDPFLQHIF